MNDRIGQLILQAGTDVSGKWISLDQARVLAQLIVRECVQVCADRGKHHDGLYSAWADDCSKRIGKHFGVEE